MNAVREAPTAAHKSRLKRKCQDLIALAETIKPRTSGVPPRPSAPPAAASSKAPAPRSARKSRELPTSEKTILLRSSKLHSSVFPPWEHDPDQSVFRSKRVDEPPYT